MSLLAERRHRTSPPAPAHHRRSTAVAALAVGGALVLAGCLSPPQTNDINLVNAFRKTQRSSVLTADIAASSKAQAWSQHMAGTQVLEHTGGGTKVDTRGVTGWCGYYENVGYGSSVEDVHSRFLASPPHRANMLSPSNRVGTGVYQSGNRVWVTEIYLRNC